jgi:3-oxoadipate enol-lactonase
MPQLKLGPKNILYYIDENPSSNSAVLLLHGLGATSESWQMQIPFLVGNGYRVLAPDTRGFGRSTYPGGGQTVKKMADDIACFLEYLKLSNVHVVGISMGGTIALQLALDYQQYINKLVLVNTFAHLKPDRFSGWLYFIFRFILVHTMGLKAQGEAVAAHIFPEPTQATLRRSLVEQITQADPAGYRRAMRALAFFNVQDRLGEIHLPTLIITGENDTTVPRKCQNALASGITGAKQVVISSAGHAVIVEKPEQFNSILIDFLG